MKASLNFWGSSKYWWVVLVLGILMVLGGFAYWFWPEIGYAVQLCVSSGRNRPKGWGWWLTGGVIDLFIGFMLVRSVILSELVFPYFIAIVFILWGISTLFAAVSQRRRSLWWLYIINGILMLVIGFLFIESGYIQDMMMTSFLVAIAFIYWGFTIAMVSYDMRPAVAEEVTDDLLKAAKDDKK